MKNKTFIYECNCIHCQQKLNQINNAKLYWDKLILKKKELGMKNKTFIKECNCIHCQQKLNQINNAKIYWDKLISRKKFVQSDY